FFFLLCSPPPRSLLFPYTTLFRSCVALHAALRLFGVSGMSLLSIIREMELESLTPCRVSQWRNARLNAKELPDVQKSLERFKLQDRKSTRLNSSHVAISYAVFCLK